MRPFKAITDQDVALLTGLEFLIDRLWKKQFGQEIESRYRIIPYHLIYMLRKYGPVMTHSVFLASVQNVCALQKLNKEGIREKQRLGEERADHLIQESVRLGLITKIRQAKGDKRVTLYSVTRDQLAKLYRIRQALKGALEITEAQSADPDNPNCGRTEDNKEWCANIKTEKIMKHDNLYQQTKQQLDKWKHLAPVIAVGALGLLLFFAETTAALARTINGGGY